MLKREVPTTEINPAVATIVWVTLGTLAGFALLLITATAMYFGGAFDAQKLDVPVIEHLHTPIRRTLCDGCYVVEWPQDDGTTTDLVVKPFYPRSPR